MTVCLPKFSKSFEMESIVVPIPIFEIHSVTSRQTKYAFREARNRRYVGQRKFLPTPAIQLDSHRGLFPSLGIEAGTSGIRVGVEHIRELPRDRVVGAEDGHWFHNCQYFYVQ